MSGYGYVHGLLTLSNVVFLTAVLVQLRTGVAATPAAAFPQSLFTAFRMLIALSAAGLLNSAATIASSVCLPRGSTLSRRLSLQLRPLFFVVIFWAQELVWEMYVCTGPCCTRPVSLSLSALPKQPHLTG